MKFKETNGSVSELSNEVDTLLSELANTEKRILSLQSEKINNENEIDDELSEDLLDTLMNKSKELESKLCYENDTFTSLLKKIDEMIGKFSDIECNIEANMTLYEMGINNEPYMEAFHKGMVNENEVLNNIRTLKKRLQERKKHVHESRTAVNSGLNQKYNQQSGGFWSFLWDIITFPVKVIGKALDVIFGTGSSNNEVINFTSGYDNLDTETGVFSRTGGNTTFINTTPIEEPTLFNIGINKIDNQKHFADRFSSGDDNLKLINDWVETKPMGETRNEFGRSHFNFVNPEHPEARDPGWHITTQVKGFGRNEGLDNGLSIHDFVDDMEFSFSKNDNIHHQNLHNFSTQNNQTGNIENASESQPLKTKSNSWIDNWINYAHPPEPNAFGEYKHYSAIGDFVAADHAFERSMVENTEAHFWNEIGMDTVESSISDLWGSSELNNSNNSGSFGIEYPEFEISGDLHVGEVSFGYDYSPDMGGATMGFDSGNYGGGFHGGF